MTKFEKRKPVVGDLIKVSNINGDRIGTVTKIEGETLRYKWSDSIWGIWINSDLIEGYASTKEDKKEKPVETEKEK